MKRQFIKFSIVVFSLIGFVSCSEDDDNNVVENPNEEVVEEEEEEVDSVFENLADNPDAVLLYQTTAQVTGAETFGAAFTDPLPEEGRRVNFLFEGPVNGEINGTLKGTDYGTMLPNGNVIVDVHATIETNDGAKIAVRYKGETVPNSQTISDLTETGTLISNHPDYAHLNDMFIVGVGTSDNTTNTLMISIYGFEEDPFDGENPYPHQELPDFENYPYNWDNIQENPNATLVYEAQAQSTNIEGFGANPAEVFGGQVAIPVEGIRMNVDFAGTTTGELSGNLSGTDYVVVLPNGNLIVDVHGIIETEEGEKVALKVDGLLIPSETPGVGNFFELASYTSYYEGFEYLNEKYIIGVGTSDNINNVLTLRLYRFDENPL
ncbi:DUF3237 family protein [Aureivirga sp. CE67]|uniref:DUF3237 family protein n=1 Tax=Aureivirga sp. CE67 TaxID=1788983 RepID=UPI0018C9B435|nr:DUF3237 family protein [Aureivirga sp. CE67]